MTMTTVVITGTVIFIITLIFGVRWFRIRQEKKRIRRDISATTYKLMGFVFELERCQKQDNPIQGIVDFFTLVSAWHDQVEDIYVLIEKARRFDVYPKAIPHLEELAGLIQKYGRQGYGMNRTKPGEKVTKEKVYLGDIHGCWTATVAELEKKEDTLKAEIHTDNGDGRKITTWDRYAQQAKNLMDSGIHSICEETRNASLAIGK